MYFIFKRNKKTFSSKFNEKKLIGLINSISKEKYKNSIGISVNTLQVCG